MKLLDQFYSRGSERERERERGRTREREREREMHREERLNSRGSKTRTHMSKTGPVAS